uniref:Uncharacterized protein n=1 Tax=viral metagenome TaxID=1070528 RepID=A0A6M3JRE6_9ZZZZ
MKWNLKRSQIEEEPDPDNPGRHIVTKGCSFIPVGYKLSLETLIENFDPADCDAQMIIETKVGK